ncbi:MAG TPA: SRPBCC family protein [Blastocatellia bacterium]
MPFKIEEQFEVKAPVQRVWEYLIDPAKVVVCIPGAELLETQDERSFVGSVKVKVGPMTMSYKGLMKFVELDEQGRQVRMTGEGREAGGAGSAKVTMLSKITPLDGGGALVVVSADVDLVGKIVQFGRGMIEEVSKQLFRQFSACVKKHLEVADEVQDAQTSESQAGENAPEPETKALSVAPLAFQAMWAVIKRFFLRLIGSKA